MDFHSLTRRELQSLCKQNKIPANITNVAMADALKSLEIVQGIEEFLNASKSETADLTDSMELLEVSSPKAPNTRCRTSTRQKVKITEAENLPPTATRTTRRGTKQLAKGVEESKNDTMKTPAIFSNRRKALGTSSCRKLNSQLNESEEEGLVEQKTDCIPNTPAAVVMNSWRTATTVKEGTVKETCTRRSTRLTAKKSSEPRVEKESKNAIQINELLDEVNVTSEDVSSKLVEAQENTVGSDTPKSEVEEICVAFEKIAVLIEEDLNVEATQKSGEEKGVYGELDNLKAKSDETSNPCEDGDLEVKPEVEEEMLDLVEAKTDDVSDRELKSDSISSPSEDEVLEEKIDLGEVVASEVNDHSLCDNEKVSSQVKIDEVFALKRKSDRISSPSVDEHLEENLDLGEVKFDATEVDDLNRREHVDLKEKLDMVEKVSSESKIDEVYDHSISSPGEDEDLDKVDLGEEFDASEVNYQNPCDGEDLEEKLEVLDHEPESDSILSPCEDEDLGEEKFDASEVDDQDLDMVSGEKSDNVVNCDLELFRRETKEIYDQKSESDGISSPFDDEDVEGELNPSEVVDQNLSDSMVDDSDNSELTDDAFNQKPVSDSISNSREDGNLIKEKFDTSEVMDQNLVMAPEEYSANVIDNNCSLESVEDVEGDDDNSELPDEAFNRKPVSDSISNLSEDDKLIKEKFDASEVVDQNLVMAPEEHSASVADNNPSLESVDQKPVSDSISNLSEDDKLIKEKFDASEVMDQNLVMAPEEHSASVADINPSPESVDLKPVSDSISNLSEDDKLIKEKLDASEVMDQNLVMAPEEHSASVVDNNPSLESVDETFDVIPTVDSLSTVTEEVQDANLEIVTEKADAYKNQFSVFPQNPSTIVSDVIGHPTRVTPMKKSVSKTPFKNMTIVSDDKENINSERKLQLIFVDEGKKIKNENNENEKHKNLNDYSIRQLRRQLKALTLKNINAKEDDAASKEVMTRQALQVLPENRLVGDQAKN